MRCHKSATKEHMRANIFTDTGYRVPYSRMVFKEVNSKELKKNPPTY